VISGMFLLFEKRFGVGDTIEVNATIGEIIGIGLLSTEIRTHDNLAVRLPNELLMKSEVKTLTRFPLRRIDLKLRIDLEEDFERAKSLLFKIAENNKLCLDEPKPLVMIQSLSDSGLEFQFSTWGVRENFLEIKNSLQIAILKAFKEQGIDVPFPKRVMIPGDDKGLGKP
jgi:small-conductance mechanosensitive channel